ncbi:hypothetical protein IJ670_01520, partial [bacterium]|nr:hypothetical protein [bacterium]
KENNFFMNNNKNPENIENNDSSTELKDTATYVPSSKFTANPSSLSKEQSNEFNQAMIDADKVLLQAQKYI